MATKKLKNFEFANHSSVTKSSGQNTDIVSFFQCANGSVFLICDAGVVKDQSTHPADLAAERIRYYLENEFVENPRDAVYNALIYANGFIYEYARKTPGFENHSVSCSLVLIRDEKVFYSTIGHSAIYYSFARKLHPITFPGHQNLDLDDNSSFLLGQKQNIHPKVNADALAPVNEDMILICSNSFYNHVSEKNIFKILSDPMPVQTKVFRLADMAMKSADEESVSLQLISFYNLENTVRAFDMAKPVKTKKVSKEAFAGKADHAGGTTESPFKPVLEKVEQPAVKYTLIVVAALLLIYMFYDLFLFDPHPPVKDTPRVEAQQQPPADTLAETVPLEDTSVATPAIPDDQPYQVRSGDTWGRIYTRFGVCSWFIRNHPPNAGKFDASENPVAGSQILIPVLYSSKRELNPDFYHEFALEKTGSSCQNADQEFLDRFKAENL